MKVKHYNWVKFGTDELG